MMVGAVPVGQSYKGVTTIAGFLQLVGVKSTWKLSPNFFLSYNFSSLFSYFFLLLFLFSPAKVA